MGSFGAFISAGPALGASILKGQKVPLVSPRLRASAAVQPPGDASPGHEHTEKGWGPLCAAATIAGAGLAAVRRPRPRTLRKVATVEPVTVSEHRTEAKKLLDDVQAHFVARLEALSADGATSEGQFVQGEWVRDEGLHGGGKRFGVVETPIFNRASVNFSAVHYDDVPTYPVASATALSVIIHPRNPFAPSMHCHFSYTESRSKAPYWRMISDLNPSLHNPESKDKFERALKKICPQGLFDDGKLFGDKYFFIPELNMYRGTSHLFIAELSDLEMAPEASRDLAQALATTTINTYTDIVQKMFDEHPSSSITERERAQQLAYHTAYFYQVLFLDCGTTAGLLAHSENDVGTLASLPSFIDASLLASWLDDKVQPPHDELLRRILSVLPAAEGTCHVSDETRQKLATTVREYYVEDRSRTKAQADMDLEWWANRAK